MKRIIAVLILAVLSPLQLPAAENPYRTAADRTVDIRHIKLDLEVSLKDKHVAGTATIDFAPRRKIETLQLNAVGHEVHSVKGRSLDGNGSLQPIESTNTGQKLVVDVPGSLDEGKAYRVVIEYEVQDPEAGLYFFQPSDVEPNVPYMVWSQGEPTYARHWIPCIDHPNERQTTEMIVTTDAKWEVLSNGRLVSKQELENGKVRFHWKQGKPHVIYLVTLAVGPFHVKRDEWRGRPVTYYVPPKRADDVEATFGRTKEMLDFFSERFGIEYPWEKYAQVVVEQFIAGGMENTSATTLYEGVLHDERALVGSSPDWLIAHELGHQWWGDLLTCKDWTHLWLNEGFASYCEILWAEHQDGRDERDYYLLRDARSARSGSATERSIVDRHYPGPWSMFDSRAYPKGAWVLHMLRSRLGDEDFFEGVQHYGEVNAYQTVETADLRQALEEVSGLTLERFFYDWTQRPGHPKLTIKTSYQADDKLVQVELKQTQDGEAFHFPLRMEFTLPDRSEPVVLEKNVTEEEATFFVPAPSRPTLVRVDPEYTLLAEITEEKSRDWWKEQVLNAPTVAERVRAVEHFGESKESEDRELLARVLKNDPFYGVRIEVAKALGESGGETSRDALIAGLDQEHPKVRRACAEALSEFADDKKVAEALLAKIEQGDRSYFVVAEATESLGKVDSSASIERLRKQLEKPSHRNVIRRAALTALGHSEKPEALEILLEWTRRGKSRNARTAADNALAEYVSRNEVSEADTKRVVERLTEMVKTEGPIVRRSAAAALGEFGAKAKSALPALRRVAQHHADGRVRNAAEEAAKKVAEDRPVAERVSELRKELKQLRETSRELKERLEKLEAK